MLAFMERKFFERTCPCVLPSVVMKFISYLTAINNRNSTSSSLPKTKEFFLRSFERNSHDRSNDISVTRIGDTLSYADYIISRFVCML